MNQGWLNTNLALIDWLIVVLAVVAIRIVSMSTRRHMKGVTDFLSANRCAGRYLLTTAMHMAAMGTIAFVGVFQMYFSAGFTAYWWNFMTYPLSIIIALTGWVYYRYRQTRALTMPQFFEMRYNRKFRILNGIAHYVCGIVNFGIFPAVAAHFFIYFCGLPQHWHIPGISIGISTLATVMAIDLGLALVFVTQGGQISVMVTECVQGMITAASFIIISIAILVKMDWSKMVQGLSTAPAGHSMLNPYQTGNVHDFNVWYFLITTFVLFYQYMAWMGQQGTYAAARNPHEQKMSNIIGLWRLVPKELLCILMPIAAYAIMHLGTYAELQSKISVTLAGIQNPAVRDQMITPIAMAHFLPVGIKGLFATCMVFFSFTCHDTYMHSWGSIFIQDVYMPLKRKVVSPAQHVRLLRCSIIFVAFFAFVYGMVYPISSKIFMYMAITGVISGAGAGAVIIGGLYWPKGTTQAAFSTMITGIILGVTGVLFYPWYKHVTGHDFFINENWMSLICISICISIYYTVSKLTCKPGMEFNLDKMLHRGQYVVASDKVTGSEKPPTKVELIFGITDEFNVYDKVLSVISIVYTMGWFFVMIAVTAYQIMVGPVSTEWFVKFWHFFIIQSIVVGIPGVIWFQIGGVMDLKALFKTLSTAVRDHSDNGSVERVPDSERIGEPQTELNEPRTTVLTMPGIDAPVEESS